LLLSNVFNLCRYAAGQMINAEEQAKRRELATKTKERERPVWATGVAQARVHQEAHAMLREEADNPFARADIDPRAEQEQREAVRFGGAVYKLRMQLTHSVKAPGVE
jgi:hypothetical protein